MSRALLAPLLFDELLIARDVQQQIDNAELFGNADLSFGMRGYSGAHAGRADRNGEATSRQSGA